MPLSHGWQGIKTIHIKHDRMIRSMKVLVLGTSNSLLVDGVAHVARDVFGASNVTNISLGDVLGSAYALFCAAGSTSFDEYDLVLFDLMVNEIYFAEGVVDKSFIVQCAEILYKNLPDGIKYCHIGYSPMSYFYDSSEIEDMHRLLCARYGVNFISLRAMLLEFALERSLSPSQLYRDHAHFKAELLRPVLTTLFVESDKLHVKSLPSDGYFREFFLKDYIGMCSNNIERKNSLVSGIFSIFENRNVISLPPDAYLIGLYFHHYSTSCFLNFESDIHLTKQMIYNKEEPYVKFTTFHREVFCSHGSRLVVSNKRGFGEISWTASSLSEIEGCPGRLELGSILFSSRPLRCILANGNIPAQYSDFSNGGIDDEMRRLLSESLG